MVARLVAKVGFIFEFVRLFLGFASDEICGGGTRMERSIAIQEHLYWLCTHYLKEV